MLATQTVDRPAELLAFLFAVHPGVKRNKMRQWVKFGSVLVNGLAITNTKHSLQVGDVVSFRALDEARAESLLPAGMKILLEDAALIVIEKPENLLSVASEAQREKTAYAALMQYVRRGDARSSQRVWIVHRLDRETSGLMVFARTQQAKRVLQAQWPETEKRYLAVVEGKPPADQGEFRSHLNESGAFKVFSAPESQQTRHAVTRYQVIQRNAAHTLIELTLETGRRNQIRVHLADAGCPIVGDQKYDARTNPARRLALHASALQFPHPVTGELLRWNSPLPASLSRLV